MDPHATLLASMFVLWMSSESASVPPTPPDSPLTIKDVMGSAVYHDLMTPKLAVGDLAHPFRLPQLDMRRGVPRPTGKTVSLASFKGHKPVALVFGSYT